jgi:hypothetical protein
MQLFNTYASSTNHSIRMLGNLQHHGNTQLKHDQIPYITLKSAIEY